MNNARGSFSIPIWETQLWTTCFSLCCRASASERFSVSYLHRLSRWNLVGANVLRRVIAGSTAAFLGLWNEFGLTAFSWRRVLLFNMSFRRSAGGRAAYGIWHIHIVLPATEHPCNNQTLPVNTKFTKGEKTDRAAKFGIKTSDSGRLPKRPST